MRLRRSDPGGPGLRRVRRGKGFSYHTADGGPASREDIERIRALVIPPAWRDVWISAHPNGHIQAVGTDAAGRKQYLYHERWRSARDEEKFDRVLTLAAELPAVRAQVHADLGLRGLPRRRVEAVAVDLLDRGVFRVGGEEYAEENGTRGVATLLREQVTVSGDAMLFDYTAKSGLRRRVRVTDAELARAVRSLRRSRADSDRLLVYRQGAAYRELRSDDINARFKELACCECSAKDLRTWQGTVLAAVTFAALGRPESERGRKRVRREVMETVAEALGNTPTVARESYVDPRVVRAWEHGDTIANALPRAERQQDEDARRDILERAVIRLLRDRNRARRAA
ncbi:DNA topoisomerase IB [Nocardia harenae]|uniref:DNA topoisomerase IB n=1 Tax=Nocardia harenae TaxID=358707 RepID=UPI00082DC896|nr:DNA topoisomerase IB [Nocardia harenae]